LWVPKQQDLQKVEEDFLRQLTADSGHHNRGVGHLQDPEVGQHAAGSDRGGKRQGAAGASGPVGVC